MKVMISGGGTGGHIFPALAIADAISRLDSSADILFIGALGRMEMEKIPSAGYPIEGLWISGLDRKHKWRNLLFPLKLVSSLVRSYWLLRRFKPEVVVGVGGFASGPMLEVACRMGIPALIQEQNSIPGLTNRMLARKANRICVAFEGMEKYFPKEKIALFGNPIRQSLMDQRWTRDTARHDLGIPGYTRVVLSLGGSLGARTMNRMFGQNTEAIASHKDIYFIWQYGALYEDEYKNSETARLPNVMATRFIDDMAKMYAAADLVVARAGALTLTELAALGKASLLIPSPNVAEDHQTANAMKLVESGAAEILDDKWAEEQGISKMVNLVKQESRCADLATKIRSFYRPDADRHIAGEVIKLSKIS